MKEVEGQNRQLAKIERDTKEIDEAIERQERINGELRKRKAESEPGGAGNKGASR